VIGEVLAGLQAEDDGGGGEGEEQREGESGGGWEGEGLKGTGAKEEEELDAQESGEEYPEFGFELEGNFDAEGGCSFAGVDAIEGDKVDTAVVEAKPTGAGLTEFAIVLAAIEPGLAVFDEDSVSGDEVGAVVFGKFPAEVVVGFLDAIGRDEVGGGETEAVKLLGEEEGGGAESEEEDRYEQSLVGGGR
jgi:hypothetical protein